MLKDDLDIWDEDLDDGTTSLDSSVDGFVMENGRRYHKYQEGSEYPPHFCKEALTF